MALGPQSGLFLFLLDEAQIVGPEAMTFPEERFLFQRSGAVG